MSFRKRKRVVASKPTNFSIPESLETVWEGLHEYREDCIPEGDCPGFDQKWSDICTAMAWITEALGYDYDENGELQSEKPTI